MAKVVLLSPPYVQEYMRNARCDFVSLSHSSWYPIWLAEAGCYLELKGHKTLLLDAQVQNLSHQETLEKIKGFQPDLVAVYTGRLSEDNDIEFADKIMTLPGDSTRNYLAALISIVGDIKKIIDVNRKSFNPVPQVDSSLININFSKREKLSDLNLEDLSLFLFRLFKHRHKTVKALFNNILKRDVYSVSSKKRVFELNESDLLRLYLENEKNED